MFDSAMSSLAKEWRDLILSYPEALRTTVRKVALENKKESLNLISDSYRLFSTVQNAEVENGRQQSVLLDWENQLKQKIQEEKFTISDGEALNIIASFGVTLFDGHPDYSRSLRRVDQALYKAKEGRNQVVYLEH